MPTSLASLHGRAAILARHRPADDPELLDARSKLREEALVRAVEKALAKAPPMTPEVRQRIVGLLAVA